MDYLLQLSPWIKLLIILAASYLLALGMRWLFFKILRYYSKKADSVLFDSLHKRLKSTVFLLIPFVIFYFSVDALRLEMSYANTIREVLQILIIGGATVVIIRLIYVAQDVLFDQFDVAEEDNLRARQARTQILFLRKIVVLVVAVVAVAFVLLSFEGVRQYGATILTSAGVAGIIIGFAAQKTIANLLAGFQIAFTQPIKIDDVVIVEGEWGWIEEINLTYVVVKIWDLRRLVIPITYFTEKTFQNWTRTSAQILGAVYIYTDYSLPIEAVRKEFDAILEQTDLWDGESKSVQVTDASEHTMTIRLLMTAKNSPVAWELRCLVREKLISFIQQNYPHALPRTRAEITNKPSN